MELFPAGERTFEQLRPIQSGQGHIGGAYRQFGSDAHLTTDGRAADAARPEPEQEKQDNRRWRNWKENTQLDVPTEPIGRRTSFAHFG